MKNPKNKNVPAKLNVKKSKGIATQKLAASKEQKPLATEDMVRFPIVGIGASAGGLEAFTVISRLGVKN
jgi:chemotaxis response regulator CheB